MDLYWARSPKMWKAGVIASFPREAEACVALIVKGRLCAANA